MKILFITTERGWHGGEEQLRLLVDEALYQGHDVLVAARGKGKFFQFATVRNWPVVALRETVRGMRSWWRVRCSIKTFGPDVIHANDPHAVTLMDWATWGQRKVSRVAARRVLFPVRSTGKYRRCDRVVCVSAAIEQVCQASGLDANQLTVIHDGVDPLRMQQGNAARGRASLQVSPDSPLLLCVAQLADYKGHQYLLAALPIVLRQYPECILALAGDGPLRESLKTQAERLGISSSVRFLGYRNDVPDLLLACDLFTLASPEEGLGTSILDAVFARRPVVAARAGGIPEMLTTGVGDACGFLAEPRSAESLAEQILLALQDGHLRQTYCEKAYAWAMQEFTATHMARRTLGLFEELISERKNRRS